MGGIGSYLGKFIMNPQPDFFGHFGGIPVSFSPSSGVTSAVWSLEIAQKSHHPPSSGCELRNGEADPTCKVNPNL